MNCTLLVFPLFRHKPKTIKGTKHRDRSKKALLFLEKKKQKNFC